MVILLVATRSIIKIPINTITGEVLSKGAGKVLRKLILTTDEKSKPTYIDYKYSNKIKHHK